MAAATSSIEHKENVCLKCIRWAKNNDDEKDGKCVLYAGMKEKVDSMREWISLKLEKYGAVYGKIILAGKKI